MREFWLRAGLFIACLSFVLVGACGGESSKGPDARLIAGGGAGDGAIDEVLHVHVINGLAGTPITGASVRVGLSSDAAPLVGTTDTAGLASFKDGKLKGPQTVTVTATGFAAATWVGANAANLTIPLEATQTAPPETAKSSGTIQGWDTRPAPADGHLLLAYVGYSFIEPFDAPDNSIVQDNITVIGLTLPANICYKATLGTNTESKCEWQLKTRIGRQALWAVMIDVDTKKTVDRADDTYSVVDYAFLLDQEAAAGHTYTSLSLVAVGANGMTDATVAFQAAPTGMASVAGLPMIKMGDLGNIVLIFSPFGPGKLTQKVPALSGVLTTGTYDFLAMAKASDTAAYPQSTIWKHGVALGGTVDFGAWQAPPTALAATSGTYSFTPVAQASLHTVKLYQSGTSGTTVAWNIGLLDGSTSFTLPSLSPNPLPVGTITMRVDALKVGAFDPADFSVDVLAPDATAHSADVLGFTR